MWTKNKVLSFCELLFVYRLRWFLSQKEDIDLESIVSMHMEGGPVVDEIVNEAFSTGGKKLCFLFYGLDEYESGYSDMNDYVFSLMHRQALPKAVVIVTTRNIGSRRFNTIKWTRRYHVSAYCSEQLKSYYLMQTGKKFSSLVEKDSNLWKLCKIPLYALLLVNTPSGIMNISTISTATEFFEELTIRTFESDLSKAHEPGKRVSFKDLNSLPLDFLKTIRIKDLKHLREYPIFAKICSLAFKGSLNTPRQYSFIDTEVPPELKWTNLSYFQIEPQPWNMEVYTFIHPTLMDFLAAVHLTSLSEQEYKTTMAEHCGLADLRYDEFCEFVCGLTSRCVTFSGSNCNGYIDHSLGYSSNACVTNS